MIGVAIFHYKKTKIHVLQRFAMCSLNSRWRNGTESEDSNIFSVAQDDICTDLSFQQRCSQSSSSLNASIRSFLEMIQQLSLCNLCIYIYILIFYLFLRGFPFLLPFLMIAVQSVHRNSKPSSWPLEEALHHPIWIQVYLPTSLAPHLAMSQDSIGVSKSFRFKIVAYETIHTPTSYFVWKKHLMPRKPKK